VREAPRDQGWLAALWFGLALLGLELVRVGLLPERHAEWWASSWVLAPVGVMGFAAIVLIARCPRIGALEAAAGMFAVNAPMVAAFVIVMLSTDWMAGTSEYPTAWVRAHGCIPPVPPVGGRVTGIELACGLAMIAAMSVLPATGGRQVARRVLLACLVVIGGGVIVASTRMSAAYVGLAFALAVFAMSWAAPPRRALLARVFSVLAFASLIIWDALVDISTISAGQFGSSEREDIVHAAEVFARIELPLPAFACAAAVLLVVSFARFARGPRPELPSASSATWLAAGVAAILVSCVGHFHAEKEMFHAQLRHAERLRFARHWPAYLPAIKGDPHEETRVSSLLLVPHLEQPASVIAMGPHGRVEQHATGDRVRVIVSEENTAESIARALKRRSETGAFELVLATEGAP